MELLDLKNVKVIEMSEWSDKKIVAVGCCGLLIVLCIILLGVIHNSDTKTDTNNNVSNKTITNTVKYNETEDFLQNATSVDFDTIKNYKNDHINDKIKIYGKVMQCQDYTILLESSDYSTIVYCNADKKIFDDVSEDDYVTIYGYYKGLYTYTTAIGGSKKVPKIDAVIVK
ncbi:MAG: Pseudogene of conserved hypothetical protein [Methanobrevibacter sp. CfCl-M3]